MSYTEEVYERVVAQNPGEPEFHQAVKEVLDSLKVVIDKNEEKYRSVSLLERLVEPERIISFRFFPKQCLCNHFQNLHGLQKKPLCCHGSHNFLHPLL